MDAKNNFQVKKFLAVMGKGRKIVRARKKQWDLCAGALCDAVIARMNPGDFFGEGDSQVNLDAWLLLRRWKIVS